MIWKNKNEHKQIDDYSLTSLKQHFGERFSWAVKNGCSGCKERIDKKASISGCFAVGQERNEYTNQLYLQGF